MNHQVIVHPLGFLIAIRLVQVFSCTEASRVHSDAYKAWMTVRSVEVLTVSSPRSHAPATGFRPLLCPRAGL